MAGAGMMDGLVQRRVSLRKGDLFAGRLVSAELAFWIERVPTRSLVECPSDVTGA